MRPKLEMSMSRRIKQAPAPVKTRAEVFFEESQTYYMEAATHQAKADMAKRQARRLWALYKMELAEKKVGF